MSERPPEVQEPGSVCEHTDVRYFTQAEKERDQYRDALERIAAHEDCPNWPDHGCARAMRTTAVVALGGTIDA